MIEGTLYINNFIDNPDSLFEEIKNSSDWNKRMISRLTTSFGVMILTNF
jgi:hypothetical protein